MDAGACVQLWPLSPRPDCGGLGVPPRGHPLLRSTATRATLYWHERELAAPRAAPGGPLSRPSPRVARPRSTEKTRQITPRDPRAPHAWSRRAALAERGHASEQERAVGRWRRGLSVSYRV